MSKTKTKRAGSAGRIDQMLNPVDGALSALAPTSPEREVMEVRATKQEAEHPAERPQGRPVNAGSLATTLYGVERGSVLRERHKSYVRMVLFYTGPEGGSLDIGEAVKIASKFHDDSPTEEEIERLLNLPVDCVSWYALNKLCARSLEDAEAVWRLMKEEARNEFESGHRSAEVFEPVHWLRDAWPRARYLAIHDSFIEQWQPQGGIDLALIDMLTQSFYMYLYWTEQTVLRTETEMRAEPSQWIRERAARDSSFPKDRKEMRGHWDAPSVTEQEAVEHASMMAERYAKAFQRNLRAMRDLRRYQVPVTINNPRQVNIATDGGQQVNVMD